MMTAFAAIGVSALLFVVYGLVRWRKKCGSDCGACASPCTLPESDDDQV